ncbi:hypothetical protein Esti_002518 [Eimeria stiedai]
MCSFSKLLAAAALCAALPKAVICSEQPPYSPPEPPKDEVARLIQHPLTSQELSEAELRGRGVGASAEIEEHSESKPADKLSSHAGGGEEPVGMVMGHQDEANEASDGQQLPGEQDELEQAN